MLMPQILLLLQLFSTFFMTGLIWFVQLVHYPLFANIGGDHFLSYEQEHQRRTTWIVAPVMLTELISSLVWIWFPPVGVSLMWIFIGAALVIGLWLCTALVQMPLHTALGKAYDMNQQSALVRTNWWRTVFWTARCLLLIGICWKSLIPAIQI